MMQRGRRHNRQSSAAGCSLQTGGRYFTWVWAGIASVILSLAGCTGVATDEATTTQKMQPVPLASSTDSATQGAPGNPTGVLAAVLQQPSAYVGKSLVLSGEFRGWKGGCKGSPPVSRQDWMLEQAGLCVYVHGPLPAGVQVTGAQGESVVVTGVLKLTEQEVPYLDATQ